ncbi:MAG: hypothetical protein VX899_26250 [Myxococcota bacterium]|nr:hypothetical protein [Myxococcota bacterium]
MLLLLSSLALAQDPTPEALPPLPPKYKLVMPFGVPQFAFERSGWGATHASAQSLAIAGTVFASVKALQAAEAEEAEPYMLWRGVALGTFTTFAASYFTSTLMGSRDYQIREYLLSESQARAASAMDFQQRRAYADHLAAR